MEAILDMPVIPPPLEQLRGAGLIGGHAGDRIGRFEGLLAPAQNTPSEPADLLLSGPVEATPQTRGGLKAIVGKSSVPFGRLFGDLAEGFTLKLRVGGKILPGTRQRWWPSIPADCL
jgi:hypothetical protein